MDRSADFVHSVREETRRYIEELLEQNQRFRDLNATLEADKLRLREERLKLQEELLSIREVLEEMREERRELQSRLSSSSDDLQTRKLTRDYEKIEHQNNILASLYVASYRLHSSPNRELVLDALKDIIVNLVGSEEFVVLEETPAGTLEAVAWFGVEEEQARGVDTSSGRIKRALESGQVHVADPATAASFEEPRVCLPLKLDGKVFALVVISQLLPHKVGLEDLDFQLFDLLADQAATALYASRLHGDRGGANDSRDETEADLTCLPL
jgi:hypothetical protein